MNLDSFESLVMSNIPARRDHLFQLRRGGSSFRLPALVVGQKFADAGEETAAAANQKRLKLQER